jgi:hypothetical protein
MCVPWVELVWNSHFLEGKTPHATRGKGSFSLKDLLKLRITVEGLPQL